MNCCLGCFAVLVILVFATMVIQALAPSWPIILGLGLSWMSMRYIHAYYGEEDE